VHVSRSRCVELQGLAAGAEGGLRAQLQELNAVRIVMPETAAFLQADLTRDPSRDLDVAERGGRRSGERRIHDDR
jgi:hypothetical protein